MILSAHQPAYLPWLGYFDRIRQSDLFVFLDNVQFERNSFTNRNRIKTSQGPLWLTVPVLQKGHLDSDMRETRIDNSQRWRERHLRSIAQNYRRAVRFEENYPKLEQLLAEPCELLADMCYQQLLFWLAELEISSNIVRASSLPAMRRKSELVLDLCLHFSADHYLSGPLGRDYLDQPAFAAAGIAVSYHQFSLEPYPQLHGPFQPGLAVLDWWMNCYKNPWIEDRS